MKGVLYIALGGLMTMHELARDTPSGLFLCIGMALVVVGFVRWVSQGGEPPDAAPYLAAVPQRMRPLPELERDMALDKLADMWERDRISDETYWATVDDVLAQWERQAATSR